MSPEKFGVHRRNQVQLTMSLNGKIERWHGTLKRECIRPSVPLSIDDVRETIERYVEHYNHTRLHGALGYVTPADRLAGRQDAIYQEHDRKLAAAR